jgi:beta-lactamase class A
MIEAAALGELRGLAQRVAVVARDLQGLEPCGAPESCPDELFPAASVIKIGIMAGLLEQARSGALSLDERVSISAAQQVGGAGVLLELEADRDFSLSELCRLMMVVSDNTASNALVRRLGMEWLNEFWAARDYSSEMRRYFLEPVVGDRDNRMSALGAARMLRDLYRGRGLDGGLREFAVGCLRRQQYNEKIPLMLPGGVPVGHKTGELEGVRHDAAVVEAERPYVLVVLTAGGAEPWLVDLAIARYSLQLYQGLAARAGKAVP